MFVARFTKTTGEPFKPNKHGEYPFIGTVVAGPYKGSIINDAIFKQQGLKENQLYACQNSVNPEYPDNVNTDILGEVSMLEYLDLKAKLGEPRRIVSKEQAATLDQEKVDMEA